METNELFSVQPVSSTRLLCTIAFLILGDEGEQREALDELVDMVDGDVNIARRMLRILDANEDLKTRHPEFYRRALRGAGESARYAREVEHVRAH